MAEFQDGDRIEHEHYGKGTITGHWHHSYEGMLWHVRFDDPGIDDDIFSANKLARVKEQCFWCHHDKGYHYDENLFGTPQMPCNVTNDETGPCLCYGWCTTKEEADKLAQVNEIFVFPNGNVAVTNNKGEQMPELQGSWINFDYIRKLASIAIRDNARVTGRMPDDHLGRLIRVMGGEGGN